MFTKQDGFSMALWLFLILCVAMSVGGCGVAEHLREDCEGSDIEMGCNTLFGYRDDDQDGEITGQQGQLDVIKQHMLTLQSQHDVLSSLVASLLLDVPDDVEQSDLTPIYNNISSLMDSINTLNATLATQTTVNTNVNTFITNTNNSVTSIMTQLSVLQGYNNITEIVAPCGVQSGWYEVLLRTSQNQLLAYFENGGNRHLISLPPGSYVTSDGHNCHFTVNPDMTIN